MVDVYVLFLVRYFALYRFAIDEIISMYILHLEFFFFFLANPDTKFDWPAKDI